MLEKFEDTLYGLQGGLLSGLIHLFQDYLPVSGIHRSWGSTLIFVPDCVPCPLRGMPPHGQSTYYATRPQVAKVGRAAYVRTSVCRHGLYSSSSTVVQIGTPTLAWLTQCSEVCNELGERVQSITKLITKFAAASDHDGCVSLRTCSVVCLSNLAELYHILSHHPLWKLPRVAITQCERTMYHLADISKELMNDDDMRHLPSYAGVSVTGIR